MTFAALVPRLSDILMFFSSLAIFHTTSCLIQYCRFLEIRLIRDSRPFVSSRPLGSNKPHVTISPIHDRICFYIPQASVRSSANFNQSPGYLCDARRTSFHVAAAVLLDDYDYLLGGTYVSCSRFIAANERQGYQTCTRP